jgi:hypothetical protein
MSAISRSGLAVLPPKWLEPSHFFREKIMYSRISDPRIIAALTTGVITGIDSQTVLEIALTADLLSEMETWPDMHFMFGGLARYSDQTFMVPVEGHGPMLFEWVDVFGPTNIRLE